MLRERTRNCLVAFSMAAASVGSALGQPGVSDPSHGRELADTLCSTCHEIEPGSKETLKTDVPTFFSIANQSGQTAERLAGAIILSPHPEMPKAALTTRELRDIISYLMSLRAKE
jgi:mono/diheme cytochrome c family protein